MNEPFMTYKEECESLRAQLAERDAEIERLKSECAEAEIKQGFCFACAQPITDPETIKVLEHQLARAQAENLRLREKLMKAAVHVRPTCDELYYELKTVLMLPPDHTALAEYVARAGEVMRERCAVMCDEINSDFDEMAEAIRAMPGVTIGDLK